MKHYYCMIYWLILQSFDKLWLRVQLTKTDIFCIGMYCGKWGGSRLQKKRHKKYWYLQHHRKMLLCSNVYKKFSKLRPLELIKTRQLWLAGNTVGRGPHWACPSMMWWNLWTICYLSRITVSSVTVENFTNRENIIFQIFHHCIFSNLQDKITEKCVYLLFILQKNV